LRRVIFGLGSIVATPIASLPLVVGQRLPDIVKQLASLCEKMQSERIKVVKDNEEYCDKEEQKRKNGDNSDESEGDGFEDDDGEDEEATGDNSDDENAILQKISKARQNMKNGGTAAAQEEEDDYDDEDDSDYEFMGGDLAIYDSALDNVDELLFVKDQFERLNVHDSNLALQLLGGMSPEEQAKFSEVMRTAQELKDREEVVRKRCDLIDKVDTTPK